MNYIIYKRLSKESKSGANLGLHAQQFAIDSFFNSQNDYQILKTFQEIETGTNKKHRPQLHAALEMCKEQNATLIIAKLDRLARNVHFVSGLMESKVNFIALDLREATPLTLHILAAVAEAEAKSISQRTSAALQELKRQGKSLGVEGRNNLEFPQTFEGTALCRIRTKLKAVEFAKKAYPYLAFFKQQGFTNVKIAQELNNLKYEAPGGKVGKWTSVGVARCLGRVA